MVWTTSHSSGGFKNNPGNKCPGVTGGKNRPPPLTLGSKTLRATNVQAGVYKLNSQLLASISASEKLLLPERFEIDMLPAHRTSATEVQASGVTTTVGKDRSYMYTDNCDPAATARMNGGCIRVSYKYSKDTSLSAFTHVGKGPFDLGAQATPGGWGCKEAPFQVGRGGPVSKESLVENLQGEQSTKVWVLRFLGLIAAWWAVHCILQPIAAAADVMGDFINYLPCGGYLEDMLEGIVGVVLCLISCSVSLSSGLCTIAVVWLFMRPLYGAALILCVVLLCGCALGVQKQCADPSKKGKKAARRQSRAGGDEQSNELAEVPMAQPQMIQVYCPEGCGPGMPVQVTAPDGRQMMVQVPDGVSPGEMFNVAA